MNLTMSEKFIVYGARYLHGVITLIVILRLAAAVFLNHSIAAALWYLFFLGLSQLDIYYAKKAQEARR